MPNKRERILAATQRLLANHGFHGFSMKQLADEAEVAAGSIYNHFENKADVILQLHLQILTAIAEYTFDGFDKTAPFKDQYRHIWLRFWHFCLQHPEAVLCKDQFDHLPPKQKALQGEKIMELFHPLTTFFDEGKAQNVLKSFENDVLSVLSIETSAALARKQLMQVISLSDEDIGQAIEASWQSILA